MILGEGGQEFPRLGLGCMSMSGIYGPADEGEAIATIRRALDAGLALLDTSTSYGSGGNQELIGKAIAGRRDDAVIHCKFGSRRDADGRTVSSAASPERVRADCEDSLRRLGVEALDVMCPSRIDPDVSVEDTVGAIARLVEAGKVRHIGLSEASPESLRRAHAVHPLASLTMEYSLFTRDAEGGHLAACRELGIALIAYSPLCRGLLTGAVRAGDGLAEKDRRRDMPRFQDGNLARNFDRLAPLAAIAEEKGATLPQVAIAWVLAQGEDVAAIPGAKTRAHLEDNLGAREVSLGEADLARLDAAFPPGVAAGERYQPAQLARVNR